MLVCCKIICVIVYGVWKHMHVNSRFCPPKSNSSFVTIEIYHGKVETLKKMTKW